MARTFAHEEAFRGKELLARLDSQLITICGTGALGSNLTDLLCRQGATKIRVIDYDRVEESNVGTQVYGMADVGSMKVNSLKSRIYRDTNVEIETLDKRLLESNAKKFFKGSDLIIDSFDNAESRAIVRDTARAMKVPLLHCGMFEGYGEVVWDHQGYMVPRDDPAAKDICDYPLARNLVQFVVGITAEEIMRFMGKGTARSWSLTLKDLSIRPYR